MGRGIFKEDKQVYRIQEFIEAYGIGRTKLYMEAAEGRLKIRKCGRTSLITKEDADAWVKTLGEWKVGDEESDD